LAAPRHGADDYPAKPVRLLVGFPPGGATDLIARILQPRLAQGFRRDIVVENRPGASGVLAADLTAKAAPDGYTLNLVSHSALVVSPAMTKVPYDPLQDFTLIARVVELPNVILAGPRCPRTTCASWWRWRRQNPARSTTPRRDRAAPATSPASSSSALPASSGCTCRTGAAPRDDRFPWRADRRLRRRRLDGGALCAAGPARALAVSGARRAAPLPDVPTVAESGWPEFEASTWYALVGPARLPQPIVERWHRELAAALAAPEIRQALIERAYEPAPSTPAALMDLLRAETAKWGPIVKALGLQSSN